MTYKRKGTQRTEPQEQKTQSHRQNLEHKVDIRAYVQQELHLYHTYSKEQEKKQRKDRLVVLQILKWNKPRGTNTVPTKHQKGPISLTFNTPKTPTHNHRWRQPTM